MINSIPDEMPLARRRASAWEPSRRTSFAIASVPLMWLCYRGGTALGEWSVTWSLALFLGGGCLLVATVLPLLVNRADGRALAGLGITRHRWGWAAAISVISLGSLPALLDRTAAAGVDPTIHLLYNLTVLWEPLFLFGWLQLSFERAFGYVCAPVLTAVAFAIYHVGSVPWSTAIGFAAAGLVLGVVFAITNNLLSMWPLTWAVSSGIGSIDAGLSFGRDEMVAGAVVLALQIGLLVVFATTRGSFCDTSRLDGAHRTHRCHKSCAG